MVIKAADGIEIRYMTPEEIQAWLPYAELPAPERCGDILKRIQDVGYWTPEQIAGRRWPIGCISLEITQRCNLDCMLCYLSEHSEAVRDLPLEEVFRRIDMIYAHYGKTADVQVSGGDPTLRKREDLIQIVKRICDKGMRASLFTNGILATRELLIDLCEAGLTDVAFHVDMTQQRKGYHSEEELNLVRQKYIERARGLPLAVFFNTTICAGNFHEIPNLMRFFRRHADRVTLVSFQLQADTGRGVLGERDPCISLDTVIEQINIGAGTGLRFDTLMAGHPACNRYAMAFAINGNLYDFYDDPGFIVPLLDATARVPFHRTHRKAAVAAALKAFARTPGLWWKGAVWLGRTLWSARHDLWAARGRINKLSFVIHNFMDACHLERDRVHACVFMVASPSGPISMCMHNARRDEYILQPLEVTTPKGRRLWQPLTGKTAPDSDHNTLNRPKADPKEYPIKLLKGRTRQEALKNRPAHSITSAALRGTGCCSPLPEEPSR